MIYKLVGICFVLSDGLSEYLLQIKVTKPRILRFASVVLIYYIVFICSKIRYIEIARRRLNIEASWDQVKALTTLCDTFVLI